MANKNPASVFIIYFLFFIAFFGNSLESYKLLPPVINWLTEPLIYLLFLISLSHKGNYRAWFPFLWLVAIFIQIALFSGFINGSLGWNSIFSLRLLIRFILFFYALTSLELDDIQITKINKFITVLLLLQIPVATIKFFIYGQGERAIGTYSVNTGSTSTMLPLIVIGYSIAFYVYYRHNSRYILASLGFVYFGIIGGKRALIFMLPVLIVFIILFVLNDKRAKSKELAFMKKRLIAIGCLLIFLTGIFSVKTMISLNPQGVKGGDFDLGFLIKKFTSYTNITHPDDPRYTGGRFATTKQVFKVLYKKGSLAFLFGYGPGSATRSRFSSSEDNVVALDDIRIFYGLTALVFLALEFGFLGVLTYCTFLTCLFLKCKELWKRERDPYWIGYAFGSMSLGFTMLMIWSYYGKNSILGDTIPLLYFYCMALVQIRLKKSYHAEKKSKKISI